MQTATACEAHAAILVPPRPRPNDAEYARLTHARSAMVPVPRAEFADWFVAAPLERLLPGTRALAAVVGTAPIGALPFPQVGSRRLVCLADGSTAIEEVLAYEPGRTLRYIVWDYTTPAAAPIAYGVGAFRFTDAGAATQVDWSYGFALKPDRFPGQLGAVGRLLFRVSFLDRTYADFMEVGLAAIEREAVAAQR